MKDSQALKNFKYEILGLLSNGIAHDINNVLSIIEGHCEIIKQHHPDFDGMSHIEEISNTVMRGAQLSKQIISFARDISSEDKSVQVKSAISDSLGLIRHLLPTNCSIETILESEKYVKADPSSIIQILVNLASNAINAMRPEGGQLTFLLCDSDDGKNVILTVQDTGKGIEPEVLENIFDPFYTTRDKDVGLGLSVVQTLIKDMGGRVVIKSELGAGTQVRITLPICPIMHELDLDEINLDTEPDDISTLLLVEDDESLAEIYQELMLDEGFVVTLAKDGVEGYHLYKSQGPFDVVLTDEQMPRRHGSEMAKMIKKHNPDQLIILLSGFDDENIKHGLEQGHIDASLLKPVKLLALVDTIKAHM